MTLTLTVAEDVFSVLGFDQRLLVDVGGDRTEFTFQELAAGATVHVFRESGEVYIQYMLNRHVSARPEGTVQLTQSVAGAQVVEAATPWVPTEASRAVLLSSLTTGASCPVPAPGIHCGVAVGIKPFVTGGVFGGFQSDAGTGASSKITVTFSPAVSSVTVTAIDPDFAGNRMIARNASGAIVAIFNFAGDDTPGEKTLSTGTVSGTGITKVELVPAPDDFVAYDNLSFVKSSVEECNFFEGDIEEPLLQTLEVQNILRLIAQLSNFSQPLSDRVERGGYIVERNGQVEFVEHEYLVEPSLCTLASDPAVVRRLSAEEGTTILAQVHTHPVHGGAFPNPGNCFKLTVRPNGTIGKTPIEGPTLEFQPGPSPKDLSLWISGVADFPGYILDPERVYRFERSDPAGGSPVQSDFGLDKGANACIGGNP